MHFQLMHESLARFSESFASFLYGLNMNAFCVDFPEVKPALYPCFLPSRKLTEVARAPSLNHFAGKDGQNPNRARPLGRKLMSRTPSCWFK